MIDVGRPGRRPSQVDARAGAEWRRARRVQPCVVAARARGRRALGRQGRQRQRRGVRPHAIAAWLWLDEFLTVERLRSICCPRLPTCAVERHRLPALRSLNFVVVGLLQEGVAASTRHDGQAKSLGEWLRARVVDVPAVLANA